MSWQLLWYFQKRLPVPYIIHKAVKDTTECVYPEYRSVRLSRLYNDIYLDYCYLLSIYTILCTCLHD
jgi:hypothetical protein